MATVTKREWTAPTGEPKTAWVCRYTDQEGKRRLKTFDKKKDADQFRTETADQIEKGIHIADRDALTVKDVAGLFLRELELRMADGRITAATLYARKLAIESRIIPAIGRTKFKDLTIHGVHEFYRTLLKAHKNTPTTAKQRIKVLASIELFALKRKFARTGVVKEALRELSGPAAPRVKTFDVDMISVVLKALEARPRTSHKKPFRLLKVYVYLAAFCGLRVGEISGLRVGSVDFANGEIEIDRSWSRLDGLKSPKTVAGNRVVPMPLHVAALLSDWMGNGFQKNPDQFLFQMRSGKPPSNGDIHKLWKAHLKRCGFWIDDEPNLHFHALRHFFASLMIDSDMPVTDLARLIGHSSPGITMSIYAHSITRRGRQNHEIISRATDRILLAPMTIEGEATDPRTTFDATSV